MVRERAIKVHDGGWGRLACLRGSREVNVSRAL